MSWRTQTQDVVWDVRSNISNKVNQIKDMLAAARGGAEAKLKGLTKGTSYVGINGNRIIPMRDAVRAYVQEIQAHLDEVVANTSTANAFHGQYATAITEYVTAVEEACKAYASQLLQFSDNLDIIAASYHSRDEQLAESIRGSARDASSTADFYKEQRGDSSYGSAAGN